MPTVFTEVKCLINSRLMGYSSYDAQPNHFLLGRDTQEISQGHFEPSRNRNENIPALSRWTKWKLQLETGDIVLLTAPNMQRGKWDLPRIIRVYPGQVGIFRKVQVRTKKGLLRRYVQRCFCNSYFLLNVPSLVSVSIMN